MSLLLGELANCSGCVRLIRGLKLHKSTNCPAEFEREKELLRLVCYEFVKKFIALGEKASATNTKTSGYLLPVQAVPLAHS